MEGRVEGVSAASQCSHPARPAPGARGEWAACRAHPSIDANEVHVVGCNVTPAHWPNHCANAICNWVSCDHLPRLWSEACRPGMRAPILTRTDASCRASRPAPRCAGTARPQPPATWGGGIMGRAAGGGPTGRNSYSGTRVVRCHQSPGACQSDESVPGVVEFSALECCHGTCHGT